MKFLIKALSIVALCIISLHNFVPHHHHSQLSEREHALEHQNAHDPVDYLALIFHNDPGAGHLGEITDAGEVASVTISNSKEGGFLASPQSNGSAMYLQYLCIANTHTWSKTPYLVLHKNAEHFDHNIERGPPSLA